MLALFLAFAAPTSAPQPARRAQFIMGTVCDITAYGPQADAAITAAFAEITRWDGVLSLYKKNSEVSALNRSDGAWFSCTASLWEALTEALAIAKASGGAFDPTILPVLREGPRALMRAGYAKVELDPRKRSARFRAPGMLLDFGGIGKGIALDHAVGVLRAHGVVSGLINFGGQIYALGTPPGNTAWEVKISGSSETLRVRDASVSISGNAEQPGHIASPFTGQRVMGEYSVAVAADSATEADAWSTALFVLGPTTTTTYNGCHLFLGARSSRSASCRAFVPSNSESTNKGDRQ